jgi:SpoVK/Ycf46/Vps4 family AAA+-type ATPase
MASADQLKALLKSHADGDDERFYTIAMQVAAHEARLGHGRVAEQLRSLVDSAKRHRSVNTAVPISKPRGELADLLSVSYPSDRLADMVLDQMLEEQLNRVIREQRHAGRLLENGLAPRRKLLLFGPPGTGKTMTASVLAGELGLPLFQIRLDGLITRYMGETAAKLRQVFDSISQTRGVYFFDEFDAIGSQRGIGNDVGEMRRVLNSFLQMIEQDQSHSIIVAATNHPEILDYALFRRFDDVLHYGLPDQDRIASLLKTRLRRMAQKNLAWSRIAKSGEGLSHAELVRAADEVLKTTLIQDKQSASESDIRSMLMERTAMAERFKPRC